MSEQGNKGLIFAADLGGTHLRAATVDHNGKIQFRFKQNTPQAKDVSAMELATVRDLHFTAFCRRKLARSDDGSKERRATNRTDV